MESTSQKEKALANHRGRQLLMLLDARFTQRAKMWRIMLMVTVTLFGIALISEGQPYTTAEAIPATRLSWNIGMKAGINLSGAYGVTGEKFDAKPTVGFVGGLFFEIPLNKSLILQPELLLSQRGFKATGSIDSDHYNLTRTSTYLDIPIFIAFKPTDMVKLLAGAQYSHLLRQHDVFSSNPSGVPEEQFRDDLLRKNTVCFLFGAEFNKKRFALSSRLGWDILSNRKSTRESSTPHYRYVWYQFMIGYKIYKH